MSKIAKFDDGYTNAKATLNETLGLLKQLRIIEKGLEPYASVVQRYPELTPAQYLHKTVNVLMKSCNMNFSVKYPHMRSHYINSDGIGHATVRLSSAVTGLEELLTNIKSKSYMIASDEQKEELQADTKQIIRDLLLYLIAQFRLTNVDPTTQYLPTYLYCEENSIAYNDFITQIQGYAKEYDAEFYIYEEPGAESDMFFGAFQNIYQLSEELHYPLTKSKALELLENPDMAQSLIEDIETFAKNVEVHTSKLSQKEVLNRMEF